jgi:hypothetical protein
MRLPTTRARVLVLGNTFIDGAHMVLAGTARGQLCREPYHCTLDVHTMNKVRKYWLYVQDGRLTCILPLRHNNKISLSIKIKFWRCNGWTKYGGRELKNILRWVRRS